MKIMSAKGRIFVINDEAGTIDQVKELPKPSEKE